LTPDTEAQISIESPITFYESRRLIFPEYLNSQPLRCYQSRTGGLVKNFDSRYWTSSQHAV